MRTVRGTTVRYTFGTEVLADLALDLLGEPGPGVVHREHDAADVERRVEVRLHQRDVAQQLTETLERVVLALDRDDHVVGRGQAVDGQQPERRRAVDEGEVVVVAHRVERPLELQLAGERRDQLDLGAGEVDGRRDDEEVLHARRLDAVSSGRVVHDHVVDRALDVAVADAEAGRRVALGVEVDHEDPVAELGERRAEVHRGGGLADATLLVGDRDDPRELERRHRLGLPRRMPGAVSDADSGSARGAGPR